MPSVKTIPTPRMQPTWYQGSRKKQDTEPIIRASVTANETMAAVLIL